MSDIYLIPKSLNCPECNENLGSPLQISIMNKIWCPRCKLMREPKEFGKQFGLIKGVVDK